MTHYPLAYYLEHACRNSQLTSRTVQGTLDTSASVGKSDRLVAGITAETAATTAQANADEAIAYAYHQAQRTFANPAELRAFIEDLATRVNAGIVRPGELIRSLEAPNRPYTPLARLEEVMTWFYQRLFDTLAEEAADPIAVAAMTEYWIDLRGHFFSDGCGKSAKAASAWLLMRYGFPLPDYSGKGTIRPEDIRKVYYALGDAVLPGEDHIQEARFAQFYRQTYF